MLTTHQNIDFKQVNKNLKKALHEIGFDISHQSCLNITSKAIGYANYNTYNAAILKNEENEKNLTRKHRLNDKTTELCNILERKYINYRNKNTPHNKLEFVNHLGALDRNGRGEIIESLRQTGYTAILISYINFLDIDNDVKLIRLDPNSSLEHMSVIAEKEIQKLINENKLKKIIPVENNHDLEVNLQIKEGTLSVIDKFKVSFTKDEYTISMCWDNNHQYIMEEIKKGNIIIKDVDPLSKAADMLGLNVNINDIDTQIYELSNNRHSYMSWLMDFIAPGVTLSLDKICERFIKGYKVYDIYDNFNMDVKDQYQDEITKCGKLVAEKSSHHISYQCYADGVF